MSSTTKARARIDSLLDANSFVEIGAKVKARATDFNLKQTDTPSDGVVTGYACGYVTELIRLGNLNQGNVYLDPALSHELRKLMEEEGMQTTANKLIFIGKPIEMNDEWFMTKLEQLDRDSKEDDENIKKYVQEVVPTYKIGTY